MQRMWPHARTRRICMALLLCAASCLGSRAQRSPEHWVTTWASAQTAPYGTEVPPQGTFDGATLREVVHLSAGGSRLALRISNVFGNGPLEIQSVHIARRLPGGGAAAPDAATDRVLSFNGRPETTVPAGAAYVSDPVPYATAALSDLVVSMEIRHAPEIATLHAGAHATTFLLPGQHAAEARWAAPQTSTRWYFLSGVLVTGPPGKGAAPGTVIAFGDSITDGHASTTDGNDRWPDVLARRLNGGTGAGMAVINEGIGGNRMLADGIGPSAAARLGRDVLAQAGATTLLVLEGINDLGGLDRTEVHSAAAHQELVAHLQAALTQVAEQAHQHHLRVIAGTLTPFVGSDYYHPSPATEQDRQALNQWIRSATVFDGVVDFDAALRDPAHPERLLPAFDSGDHLHPGPAGYQRMGEAVPLDLLQAGSRAARAGSRAQRR